MAKRFTATTKWQDPWFRRLSPEMKCFWIFLLDSCDNAGVWVVDLDMAAFCIGKAVTLGDLTEDFWARIHVFARDKKWFIRRFAEFQYGVLNPSNRMHKHVIELLSSHNLLGSYKGLTRALEDPKDKDKRKREDKVLDKDKRKDKDIEGNIPTPGSVHANAATSTRSATASKRPATQTARAADFPSAAKGGAGGSSMSGVAQARFDQFWAAYPRKTGKGAARKWWARANPDDALLSAMLSTLDWQCKTQEWAKNGGEFIPHPTTWLNAERWTDEPREAGKRSTPREPEPKAKPPEPLPADLAQNPERWAKIVDALKAQVDAENFETWIKPVGYLGESDGVLYIEVPSAYNRSWIHRYYADRIVDLAGEGVDEVSIGIAAEKPEETEADDLPF